MASNMTNQWPHTVVHRAMAGCCGRLFALNCETPILRAAEAHPSSSAFFVPSAIAARTPRISGISNRYSKLLEFPVTYTKQTTAPLSNRYRFAFLKRPVFRRLPSYSFPNAPSTFANCKAQFRALQSPQIATATEIALGGQTISAAKGTNIP
ncbi:MAG TPA: hypothetical protein VNF02_03270 [Candidatus Limnocylindrales bacterium]|nr:hypothetical protein [Candidatus Limnocylindrales bacterium]